MATAPSLPYGGGQWGAWASQSESLSTLRQQVSRIGVDTATAVEVIREVRSKADSIISRSEDMEKQLGWGFCGVILFLWMVFVYQIVVAFRR